MQAPQSWSKCYCNRVAALSVIAEWAKKDETLSPYMPVKFTYPYLQPSLKLQNCSLIFLVPFLFPYSHEKSQRWDFFPVLQLLTETSLISPLGFTCYRGRRKLLFVQAFITSWRIQGPVIPVKFSRALISKKSQVWT